MAKNMADFLKRLGAKPNLKETMDEKKPVEVVSEDDTPLPTTETVCHKCGNTEAYWWSKQTRASDEPETKFLKCTKCKNTWRDAS